jgi:hypothetical protein
MREGIFVIVAAWDSFILAVHVLSEMVVCNAEETYKNVNSTPGKQL